MIDPVVIALAGALRLAQPTEIDLKQTECVADAVYFEARGEPLAAQVAVASVVVGRGRPCDVVRAPRQFAYRTIRHRKRSDRQAWTQAVEVAVLVGTGAVRPYQVTHFHDTSVSPKWATSMAFEGRAGNLLFWRGK